MVVWPLFFDDEFVCLFPLQRQGQVQLIVIRNKFPDLTQRLAECKYAKYTLVEVMFRNITFSLQIVKMIEKFREKDWLKSNENNLSHVKIKACFDWIFHFGTDYAVT